jgi:hypothetical protein
MHKLSLENYELHADITEAIVAQLRVVPALVWPPPLVVFE